MVAKKLPFAICGALVVTGNGHFCAYFSIVLVKLKVLVWVMPSIRLKSFVIGEAGGSSYEFCLLGYWMVFGVDALYRFFEFKMLDPYGDSSQ